MVKGGMSSRRWSDALLPRLALNAWEYGAVDKDRAWQRSFCGPWTERGESNSRWSIRLSSAVASF